MQVPINVKSPNNISKWQMGFNSAFKGLMKFEFLRQIFAKYPNIKFHENLSNRSRAVPCGRTDGRRDMAQFVVAFRNFANAPLEA
jgi:hypothetical protein